MTGGFLFKLTAKRIQYEFMVKRKIMRITGDSAKGKSELVRAAAESAVPGSGTVISCRYKCRVISNDFFESIHKNIQKACSRIKNHSSAEFRNAMRGLLSEYDNLLFFADEDFAYMELNSFALFCKYTDSFFILIRRTPLCKLPYSYTEIYTILESGKFHTLAPKYDSSSFSALEEDRMLIVEDSNSGYEFFKHFYENTVSANGKSKIRQLLSKITQRAAVIADGAAFGCEIENLVNDIQRQNWNVRLFLPESFEQLLLTSSMFDGLTNAASILNPAEKADGLFFSLEQYYTDLLIHLTEGLENCYAKRKLNACYYLSCCCKKNQNCNLKFTADKKEAVLGRYLA